MWAPAWFSRHGNDSVRAPLIPARRNNPAAGSGEMCEMLAR